MLIGVQVAIRVRPPLLRELEGYQPFQNTALVDTRQTILTVSENLHAIQNGGSAADAGLVRPYGLFVILHQVVRPCHVQRKFLVSSVI
jgi:hypothetical protein